VSATELDGVPLPGTILADKYLVVRILGQGGMGVVLEAHHMRLEQSVALKILLPEMRALPHVVERFEREARAAARLVGSNVARVFDVERLPDGSTMMVMEMLRGRELGHELADRGKMPYQEAVGYILQACSAMAEAHALGIVHRDLKPQNLFLADQPNGPRIIKVLDFGISKKLGEVNAQLTTTATAFGSPIYMSPEQVRSAKDVDARTDIWSLGVVLYELLAGDPPFSADSATAILASIVADAPRPITEHRPDIPPELAACVMKAIEKSVAARFSDINSFAAAIAPFGPGTVSRPATDRPPPLSSYAPPALTSHASTERVPPRSSSIVTPAAPTSRRLIAGVTAAGIALVAGAVLVTVFLRRGPDAATMTELPAALPDVSSAPAAGPTALPVVAAEAPTATAVAPAAAPVTPGAGPAPPALRSPAASPEPVVPRPPANPAATASGGPPATPASPPTPATTPAPPPATTPAPPPAPISTPPKPPPITPPEDPKYL
jgi:serine/threonine-protein kinase